MEPAEAKQFIRNMFSAVIEDMDATEEIYANYFSAQYVQYVDRKRLDYRGFVTHMRNQKAAMASVKVSFKRIIAEVNEVCTIHLIDGVKKEGGIVRGQVNAYFQIENNKIILCDELTFLTHGEESDRGLGSR